MAAIFQQAVLAVADPSRFGTIQSAIDQSFAPANVEKFFRSLSRRSLRIRNFEQVLTSGYLGEQAAAEYTHLGNADQGQIREHYLASLEKVQPELRRKFFKLYAYY